MCGVLSVVLCENMNNIYIYKTQQIVILRIPIKVRTYLHKENDKKPNSLTVILNLFQNLLMPLRILRHFRHILFCSLFVLSGRAQSAPSF